MRYLFVLLLVLPSYSTKAKLPLTVEELRITKANEALSQPLLPFETNVKIFAHEFKKAYTYNQLRVAVKVHSQKLWDKATKIVQTNPANLKKGTFDDRPLYWARLKFAMHIRQFQPSFDISDHQRQELIWLMERRSRGELDIDFNNFKGKRILITGFDPFFLDRNIDQSNPSGLAALYLDDKVIEYKGEKVMIQSAIFPVRFEDFDLGEIENFLRPYLAAEPQKKHAINMLVTISMGRDNFDLERFPALRRSAQAPDNLNVYTGASETKPLIPWLGTSPLQGPEFVEFSLPVQAMRKIQEPYKVNDNHKVSTLDKSFEPKTLAELDKQISVSGSGGGYLSNEISYRSINLRQKLGSKIPSGHLHTPRVVSYDHQLEKSIIAQIEQILIAGATSL